MRSKELFKVRETDIIENIEIDKSYTFFDGVIDFIAGICSISLTVDAYKTEARPYLDGHYLYFEGRKNATNKIYYVFPYDIYKYIMNNDWPETIKIHFKHKDFDDQEQNDEQAILGFEKVFIGLGQAIYIQFWESIKSSIINTQGKDQSKWDNLFQFGWIIRNALAHNFKVTINNPKIDNVKWHNISFGFSTNGKIISDYIMFFELIFLMKDIEDKLKNTVPNTSLA